MRNIRYIGNSAVNRAFYPQTGIVWTPGKVDTVLDDKIATEMLLYTDVFEDAGDSSATVNGASGAVAVTSAGMTVAGQTPTPAQAAAVRAGIDITKISKLRASIAGARNHNPQVLPPHTPAPTWAASTAYGAGQVVRGTGADAVHLYFMAGNNTAALLSGTSEVSGTGPSGSGSAVIVDGTCRWQYVGRSTSLSTVPFISTATLTTAASEMNGAVQIIAPATGTAIGLVVFNAVTYTAAALVTGGLFGDRNADSVNSPNNGSASVPVYQARNQRSGIALVTNSRKWIGFHLAGPMRYEYPLEIHINGIRMSETQLAIPADSADNLILINMSLFPDGDKTIKIRAGGAVKSDIVNRWYLEPGATVRPASESGIRMTVEGDSVAANSYFTDKQPAYWFERILCDRLGIDQVYNNAVGATGAINNASGTKTTYIDRISDIVAFSPDIHVVNGFHNDVGESGAYTSVSRRAAFGAYFSALRQQLPNTVIFVVGSQLLQGESMVAGATTQWQVELDAKASIDSIGDENIVFIPVISSVHPLLSSANGPHFMVGTAPYSDSHPTPAYYPYIGSLIAEQIALWASEQ